MPEIKPTATTTIKIIDRNLVTCLVKARAKVFK